MTERAQKVGRRLAEAEPVTRIHHSTNLDGSILVAVLIELAKASLVLLPLIAGGYVIAWAVLAIKAS